MSFASSKTGIVIAPGFVIFRGLGIARTACSGWYLLKPYELKVSSMPFDPGSAKTSDAIPDLDAVRAFLRNRCQAVAIDRHEMSYLKISAKGRMILLYEAPGPGGQLLYLAARRADAESGRKRAGARQSLPETGRREFLEGYFAEPEPPALPILPAHAAMHCFLHAYQCLRHPPDAAGYEDAEAMLAACEAALGRGGIE